MYPYERDLADNDVATDVSPPISTAGCSPQYDHLAGYGTQKPVPYQWLQSFAPGARPLARWEWIKVEAQPIPSTRRGGWADALVSNAPLRVTRSSGKAI